MKKTLPFLLTLALLLTACMASKTVAHTDLLLPQKEQTWQLVARQGHPLNRTKAAPSLVINPDAGVATGFAYCNEYTFKLELVPAGSQPDGDYYTIHLGLWGYEDIYLGNDMLFIAPKSYPRDYEKNNK